MFWSEQQQTFSVSCILSPFTWGSGWQEFLWCKTVYFQIYVCPVPLNKAGNSTCSAQYTSSFLPVLGGSLLDFFSSMLKVSSFSCLSSLCLCNTGSVCSYFCPYYSNIFFILSHKDEFPNSWLCIWSTLKLLHLVDQLWSCLSLDYQGWVSYPTPQHFSGSLSVSHQLHGRSHK